MSGGIGVVWGVGAHGASGIRGKQGCRGCQGAFQVAGRLGAQPYWAPVQGPSTPTGSPWRVTYLTKTRQGPLLRAHHSHWFPLGSDLPDQGMASDRNELCRLLYTLGTTFSDSLHICIYPT